MELFSRQTIASLLLMTLLTCCSTQATLQDQHRTRILDEVFQSIGESILNSTNLTDTSDAPYSHNATDISDDGDTSNKTEALDNALLIDVINKSLSEPGTDLPATIRVIIGFMATREQLNGGLPNVTGSQQTDSGVKDNSSGATVETADEGTLATEQLNTATEHTLTGRMSSMAHIPDGQMVDASPNNNHPDTRQQVVDTSPGEGNPIIQPLDEPVAPPSPKDQQGSLPLVLGATIVVVFAFGVIGATIKAKCRKRKLAKKEALPASGDNDVQLERGLDNPAFIDMEKSHPDLSLMFSSHQRPQSQMNYTTPTIPLY